MSWNRRIATFRSNVCAERERRSFGFEKTRGMLGGAKDVSAYGMG
jgi:hypothetical protein